MQFVMRDRYECSVEKFWASVFFDESYNTELYLEGLGFDSAEVLAQSTDDAGNVSRSLAVQPKLDVPKALAGLFGDGISYTELGRYDASTGRYEAKVVTSRLAKKINITLVLWMDPQGDEVCDRVVEFDIKVRILGVGRLVESFLASAMRTNYSTSAEWTNRWLMARWGA
jgi:hypothetical protein